MIRKSFNEKWEFAVKADMFGGERKPITLPHDAMIWKKRSPNADGGSRKGYFQNDAYEYSKNFFVPSEQEGKTMIVEFEGVYANAMVYVNGEYAGQWPSGYTCFSVKIDQFIRYDAENNITVLCSSADDSRWYSGTGIYRDTNILVSDRFHIGVNGIKISTPDIEESLAVASVQTLVENEGLVVRKGRLVTEIVNAKDEIVASGNTPVTVLPRQQTILSQRLYIKNPVIWDVDSPYLYKCQTRLVLADESQIIDESQEFFGIRKLQLDPENGLRINGKTVKLRGACIHHDNGVIGAATIARADERRVEILKAAGFNAIRSAHHPMGKALLNACDRIGMLVMDELSDMWFYRKTGRDAAVNFPEWWERDVEAMVDKDYNHPCVIMYSIGNEIGESVSNQGVAIGRRLSKRLHELDGTRYTLNSINGMLCVMDEMKAMMSEALKNADINTLMGNMNAADSMARASGTPIVGERTEEAYDAADIAGYNYMDVRYVTDKKLYPNRIIVGSETMAPHIPVNWKLVKENAHVIGDFTWVGWEYLGEAGLGCVIYPEDMNEKPAFGFEAAYPWLVSGSGDIDITGYRRPASYFREIVFGLRKEPYIAVQRPQHYGKSYRNSGWNFTDSISSWTWPGFEEKPVIVEVFADADEAELMINGSPVGRVEIKENEFRCQLETYYVPGILEAIVYKDGKEVGRTEIKTAANELSLKAVPDRMVICEDSSDLCFLEISITDSEGILNTSADRLISVNVAGSGILQGFGSGVQKTEENFFDLQRMSFDGRALAVIRPTNKGEITIQVQAEGCKDVLISVAVE